MTKAVGMSVPQLDAQREAFAEASRFRSDLHACLTAHRDELFELTDAMLCADGPVMTPVDLTLLAEHRRGHGALYAALNHSRIDVARLRRTLAAVPQPKAADDRLVLAVDVSNWLRPDAECSADRLFCHTFGRGPGPAPDDPGLAVLVRRRAGERPYILVPAAGRGAAWPGGRRR